MKRSLLITVLFVVTSLNATTKNNTNELEHALKDYSKKVSTYSDSSFMATYKVENRYDKHMLKYYRNGNVVAYSYPSQKITEVYKKLKNNGLSLIKAFDANKRAIEYDPVDMRTEGESSDWQSNKNLPTPSSLNLLDVEKKSQEFKGMRIYTKRGSNSYLRMLWYEPKQLLLSLEVYKNRKLQFKYTLVSLEKMDDHLNRIANYQTTDFADIGDHEDDPFLVKLIDLGFVSHHEATVLDTNGNLITKEHSGHHH